MDGKTDYENKLMHYIQVRLNKYPEYLTGYYNFIGVNKTLQTRYNYITLVSTFMDTVNKDIKDLTMDDFSNYISKIYSTKSSSYAITSYASLKLFGRYLLASRRMEYDPMEYLERPKYRETIQMVKKRELGVLEKNEIKKYTHNLKTGVGSSRAKARQEKYKDRDMLIVMLFLTTGMRCSALMRLDVKDIDFDNKKLIIYDKGNKIKEYDITENVFDILISWIDCRKSILGEEEQEALFISNRKNRITQKSISDIVKKYSAGIEKNITPHKLRATFGTQVYAATKDIYYTQQCMGHSSPQTTELYVRGETKNTKQAASIMSKLI